MKKSVFFAVVGIIVCITCIAEAAEIHVPTDQPTIQAGIDASINGDTVIVADGTYTGDGNVNLDFGGKDIHLESAGGAVNCIIDCESSGRGFYFHSGETSDAIVDGFTITNGNGNNYSGGAMYFTSGTPTIRNCRLTGNSTSYGGGAVAIMGSASPSFDNCLIANNNAYSFGGGVYCYATGATPTFTNCTIADNHGSFGGGIFNAYANPTLNNCIIWGNTDNIHIADQIRNQSGTFTMNNCCYADGWGNVYGTVIANNCITDDPLFLNADADDYHLEVDSPCIDAGDSTLIPEDVIKDLDGRKRVWGADVDMGPYEGGTALVPLQYPTIQDGLDAASDGDVVLVANGIYSGAGNNNLDFCGKAIYLKSIGGPENCIIDCSSRAFHFYSGENLDTVIDGFQPINGYSDGNGGAVLCENTSSPTLRNFIFINNQADHGGGAIACYESSNPTIVDCRISNNSATHGGGIYCNDSNPTISWCTITNNSASSADDNSFGGGIYCYSASPTIVDCFIANNSSVGDYGSGGGIACRSGSNPTIRACIIADNEVGGVAGFGGGINCVDNCNPTIIDCIINSNAIISTECTAGGGISCVGECSPTIINCKIVNNYVSLFETPAGFVRGGGGIYLGNKCDPVITNCTIADNWATSNGGGICLKEDCHPTLNNTIIWGNSADWLGHQIYTGGADCNITLNYCDYANSAGDVEGAGTVTPISCILSNPLFVVDYHLHKDSECVDKGDNSLVPSGLATDLDGNRRVLGGTVDIGCYESTYPVYWAVIVGISDYYDHDPAAGDLESPAHDAALLLTSLRDQHEEWARASAKKRIQLLTIYKENGYQYSHWNPGERTANYIINNPKKETIKQKIEKMVADAGPYDTILFHFIGHGVVDDEDTPTQHCIIPADGYAWPPSTPYPDENISEEELKQWLSGAPDTAKLLVVIDSCFSGGMDDLFVSPGPTREILTSAQEDQKAFESPNLPGAPPGEVHAAFTWYFMRAIKDQDPPTDDVALEFGDPEGGYQDTFISAYEVYKKVLKYLGPYPLPEYPIPTHHDSDETAKLNFVKAP